MSIGQIINTVEELRELPDGTIVKSLPGTGWQHEGRRHKKVHGDAMWPLDPHFKMGLNYSAMLSTFKDPLPAEVVGFEEVKYVDTDELFGGMLDSQTNREKETH